MAPDPMCPGVRTRRLAGKLLFSATLAAGLASATSALAASPYTLFESGQVRPIALSPSGHLLFALNTPGGRLEVFHVDADGLHHRVSVPVGVEPIAVAARSDSEVWVVNHLSDSVSVVDLAGDTGGVVRTLLVGDEPRDIVFAGPGRSRAFVTTAHRGQNSPVDPQLTTPGVGRADVWVFDADHLGDDLNGSPITIVNLFSDTPRALAVSPDGSRVYAAGFQTGNRTTAITQSAFTDEEQALLPGPQTNFEGVPAPAEGIIVKFDGSHWVDEAGTAWDDKVRFSLPDKDVFVLDATADPPAQVAGGGRVLHRRGDGALQHGGEPGHGPGVRLQHRRAQRRELLGPRHLRRPQRPRAHRRQPRHRPRPVRRRHAEGPQHPHRLLALLRARPQRGERPEPGAPDRHGGQRRRQDALRRRAGVEQGAVLSTAAIEGGTYQTSTADQVIVSGGGPTGLALDEAHGRLYVLTRFDDAISIVDTAQRAEIGKISMQSPEPPSVTTGRRFFYDAAFSSAHGDSACASCHVFGDFDSLAWNLGNPDASTLDDPNPFASPLLDPVTFQPVAPVFNPMKGPMTTQSLRGMANHGPMHWRGDQTGAYDAPSAQPDSGAFDERADFMTFQGAFIDFVGRSGPIQDEDMAAFTDFILQLRYPPNPIRNLDSSLTPDQQAGRDMFTSSTRKIDAGLFTCTQCHTFDPQGNAQYGVDAPGFFGTSGFSVVDPEPLHLFKVPHLRNLYQKVGMFGMTENSFFPFDSFAFTGDQVRGFGFLHDGSTDSVFRFHGTAGFTTAASPDGFPLGPDGVVQRRQVESFMLAFDSNLAPIVGQQVTFTASNGAVAAPRVALLESRAEAGECDLVAKSWLGSQELGFLYTGGGQYLTSGHGASAVDDASLEALGAPVTYTCLPPGEGARVAFDQP